jgi:hypothetical protein
MSSAKIFFVITCITILNGCTTHKNLYNDRYDENTFIYNNSGIGFTMRFDKEWQISESHDHLPEALKKVNLKYAQAGNGGEVLCYGKKMNNAAYVRALVEKSNVPVEDFFAMVLASNKNDIKEFTRQNIFIKTKSTKMGLHHKHR